MTTKLQGTTSLVAGLGSTGLSVARYLKARDADAVFYDSRTEPPGIEALEAVWPDARLLLGVAMIPEGIDLYFDNVGGDTLQAAMERLRLGARVVLCGLMAQYNTTEMPPGPNPAWTIKARATVRGMVVYDHEDLRESFVDDVARWLAEDRIRYLEDRTQGLEHAAEAFSRLMRGENVGKVIVEVGAE